MALRTFFSRKREELAPPPPEPLGPAPAAVPDPLVPLVLEALSLPATAPEPLRTELVDWAEETAAPIDFADTLDAALTLQFEAPPALRGRLVDWAAETAPLEPPSVLEHFAKKPTSDALVLARKTPVPADPFAALWSKLFGRGISWFARGKRLARALLGRMRTKSGGSR
jgi:hypothetical protein